MPGFQLVSSSLKPYVLQLSFWPQLRLSRVLFIQQLSSQPRSTITFLLQLSSKPVSLITFPIQLFSELEFSINALPQPFFQRGSIFTSLLQLSSEQVLRPSFSLQPNVSLPPLVSFLIQLGAQPPHGSFFDVLPRPCVQLQAWQTPTSLSKQQLFYLPPQL